jgi:hypothetical protein
MLVVASEDVQLSYRSLVTHQLPYRDSDLIALQLTPREYLPRVTDLVATLASSWCKPKGHEWSKVSVALPLGIAPVPITETCSAHEL